ncbi:MAG: threonylcarbamoyl-AMP synthase [Candidatus Taylorbacteria bacterium RIFCSPHIGHO2_02_FULL_44_36]|uniref:L-threonylcarbamoyladenylate synthase n=1 Tax=Candidatus Taylorbacteria bacterium RIFCSPLOWO2_12_FULL_44_15c TaxID=1802333 RepID=A0A1G2P5J9_9BACT|nr:MAG: threonylcarbamoyl-AMP synthase [Candidatus Taylorbacteria bacterium RIFCSPHIGHO2_02_FULL_44_36]OHA37879.1 MAG: threonylcarbamoyl-AMP synthase [Candidatus Taylorbacteria bacterium RIFCSPLOWO2_02_FULL_44_35]OHA42902.1 MAG: threonylcarbamoyl-AMP synthase [Candidatus Taylorbacteria bacterium RIFCSPLOWO2_12_FULL_44_15c]
MLTDNKLNDNNINCLKNGGVGVLPTDTLYGLVGSAFSPVAVEKIYRLKKRDPKKPLIVLIANWQDLEKFGIEISAADKKILGECWPGPTSVILPTTVDYFTYLHRGTNTIAFRLPKDKRLLKILKETGPLVAPSTNPEGLPPAISIAEAKKYFGDQVSFYEDGGTLADAPSTLIKLENGKIKTLRKS